MLWGWKLVEIKNRLFPYPVLCEDTDDYTDGLFSVSTEIVNQDINNIELKFKICMDNAGLKDLILQGRAEYVIHLECSNTAFRTAIHTFSDEEVYHISNSRVNGEIALLGMVVSLKDIPFYRNSKLNSDYNDVDLMIPRAAILAYYNMPKINVLKNYEELAQEESLFSVVKEMRMDQNEERPIHFQLDPERIKIYVDEDVYSAYLLYQNNITMRPLIMSLLVMPALTYMVEELRRDDNTSYKNTRWFLKFLKLYQDRGKDFVDDIIYGDQSITEIVQEMLQLPIEKTFLNMREMLGE